MSWPLPRPAPRPALQRLETLAPLDSVAREMIMGAIANAHALAARREVIAEGAAIGGPRLIVSGWAARVKLLSDGRRQFLSFLLPGDFIAFGSHPAPRAPSTIITLTAAEIAPVPDHAALQQLYAISAAMEESYLLEHIVRLGRLNALERIYSLLLELDERLARCGISVGGCFPLPLTQEILADALGLTSVHINRTIQEARRLGTLELSRGYVRLRDPEALAIQIGRTPVRIGAR